MPLGAVAAIGCLRYKKRPDGDADTDGVYNYVPIVCREGDGDDDDDADYDYAPAA
ncbi:UNVERIFIED_CONTAM: hypothetical protein Sradi_4066700 [Sesamum radiatum]|uniref:Uncharacterized protein n=1 Tax=Sesamum radiatum TaxID=300843 RepID=A0AAW2PM90_SESRA